MLEIRIIIHSFASFLKEFLSRIIERDGELPMDEWKNEE